jgi:hypothetical protein
MCGPLVLTVAGIALLSVGTCLGFVTAALFAAGAEPAQLAKPKMAVSIPQRHRRIGLAGSRKPLHSWLLLARWGGSVWPHGGRSACAAPRRRSLSRATKGRRIRGAATMLRPQCRCRAPLYRRYIARLSGRQGRRAQGQEAILLNRRHRSAHKHLGELYLILGDPAKAAQQLTTLEEICLIPCVETEDLKRAIAAYKMLVMR